MAASKLQPAFPVLIASAIILYAVYNLGTISRRVDFIESADDINLTLLELRRYEKNILLFREGENVKKFNEYLRQLDIKIVNAEKERCSFVSITASPPTPVLKKGK